MSRVRTGRLLGLLVLAGAIAWVLTHRDQIEVSQIEAWVMAEGSLAPLLFVAAYVAGTVLVFPGSLMTIVGGAVFGTLWGSLFNLVGATAGALAAFLIARYLAGGWVTGIGGGRLRHLVQEAEAEGWRFVALLRLVPVIPFTLLNYALGLTRIRLSHYLLATALFMAPATVAYTYLGAAGRAALVGEEGALQKALLGVALLAAVVLLPRLIRRLRGPASVTPERVRECLADGHPVVLLDVRSEDEARRGPTLAGARHIALERLQRCLPELGPSRECPVMVLASSQRVAALAVGVLTRSGFDARIVEGGLEAWLRLPGLASPA